MSFGFGIGDFITVIKLATKLRKDFSDAPKQFECISDEVKSLGILLSDVAVYEESAANSFSSLEIENLKTVVNGSTNVLEDLNQLLSRFETLSPGYKSHGKYRVKRIWDRLKLDEGDISELRSRLTSNITMLEAHLRKLTERTTQKSLAKLENHVDVQEQQRILDLVSKDCDRHTDRLNWLLERRESGTRKWLFESDKWNTWTSVAGRGTTLFCPGIPGAGKTHTSAMAIERLYEKFSPDEIRIAFVFCDYQQSDDKEHVILFRSLLRMFLEQSGSWPTTLTAKYEDVKRFRPELTLDEVLDVFKALLCQKRRDFIIIDALDEINGNARSILMQKLFELQKGTGLNIFATSRDIGQISQLFSLADQIKISARREDIEQYISSRTNLLPSFVLNDKVLQSDVKEAVVRAAGEMFLLADLHLHSLETAITKASLLKSLKSFSCGPKSVTEALEKAMQRVTSQPTQLATLALRTLMILITARCHLTVNELRHALAVDLENLDNSFHIQDNVPSTDVVLSSCAGLIIVQTPVSSSQEVGTQDFSNTTPTSRTSGDPPGDSIVQLAHKSIRDYLSSPESGWFSHAEAKMATICRTYSDALNETSTAQEYPFLAYVKQHWGYHHLMAEKDTSVTCPERDLKKSLERQGSFPLEIRQQNIQFGLRMLAHELSGMREMFIWACKEGKVNVVEVLLTINLDSYTQSTKELNNSEELFNEDCGYPGCPVHDGTDDIYPIQKVSPETALSVNDVCSGVRASPRAIDEALGEAVRHKRQAIVGILLEHEASLSAPGLNVAAWEGHDDMVDWLLRLDSLTLDDVWSVQQRFKFFGEHFDQPWSLEPLDINHRTSGWLNTPNMSISGIKLPTPRGKSEGRVALTPLSAAALNGHETVVNTIFHWIRNQGCEAKPEWKASCLNAMLCAIQRHHLKIVRLLLPFIDVNSAAPGLEGYTLLHLAILTHNIEAIIFFLNEPDINPNLQDAHGRTALALAVKVGAESIIQELCACEKIQIDCASFVEAYVSNNQPLITLLCQHYRERNTNGFLSSTGGQYSCYEKIIFGCLQHIKNLWGSVKGQYSCDDIENVNLFDLVPVNWTPSVVDGDPYFKQLATLGMTLLESDGLHTADSAGHQDRDGWFGIGTIYVTLASRSTRLLERLLELHPASVSNIDKQGQTALMAAFKSNCTGSVDIILQFLSGERNASVINAVSESGYSALTYAVWRASQEHIHALITLHTFDLRLAFTKDKDGKCPLMWVADPAARKPLYGRWASLEARWRSCLEICQSASANLDCDELSRQILDLGEDNSGKSSLSYFCQLPLECLQILQILLQSCPPLVSQLHLPDTTGMTPLIYSSQVATSHDVCTFLLDRNEMNSDHRDKSGRTALSYIAEGLDQLSDGGLAARLVKKRGKLLATDNQGWSPLRYAIANGNVWEPGPYYQLLEDPDTEVEWTDEHGSNVLHLALRGGSPEAVELLLRRPSSAKCLNAPDADGRVPLAHIFTHFPEATNTIQTRGREKCCCYCPHYPDRRLLPTRRIAQQKAQLRAMKIVLSRHDILVNSPDKDGRTPLWHALEAKKALKDHLNPWWIDGKVLEQSHELLATCIESLRAAGGTDLLELEA